MNEEAAVDEEMFVGLDDTEAPNVPKSDSLPVESYGKVLDNDANESDDEGERLDSIVMADAL